MKLPHKGHPKTFMTDNGAQFVSTELEFFMKKEWNSTYQIIPYHPLSNSLDSDQFSASKET